MFARLQKMQRLFACQPPCSVIVPVQERRRWRERLFGCERREDNECLTAACSKHLFPILPYQKSERMVSYAPI